MMMTLLELMIELLLQKKPSRTHLWGMIERERMMIALEPMIGRWAARTSHKSKKMILSWVMTEP